MASNGDDEFGDSSLFENLDLDQMVEQHEKKRLSDGGVAPSASSSDFPIDLNVDEIVAQHQKQKKRSSTGAAALASLSITANNENLRNGGEPKRFKSSPPANKGCSKPQQQQQQYGDVTDLFQQTLQEHFGFDTFRPGQLEVIEAVAVQNRDAAVFWATGKGKSLCYQIPALCQSSQGQVVVVISPLISLMQDQVDKLNGLAGGSGSGGGRLVANYLGSGQTDPTVEGRALRGEFSLLYVTPEKFVSGGLLPQLEHMHQRIKPIALIAVDEAHCVSEWGHDFRPEFRAIGTVLRGRQDSSSSSSSLKDVPILALTATAVPRVQDDILQSLHLRDPLKALQSFDRSNLAISVHKKASGGVSTTLMPFLKSLQDVNTRPSQQSTIVYAPSRATVEEIALFLQNNLGPDSPIVVEAYHAGMSPQVRHTKHTNFLTGRCHVIVSTVAFGMGIDKPDTRRVVHYGPPKTVEEYYQQIGRAGRDGLPAECVMFVSEGDFDQYQSNFYLGNLNGKALEATKQSIRALRAFSLDPEGCRRKSLLDYFCQASPFGERCGTCDTCLKRAQYGSDSQRDFGPIGARLVLEAVDATRSQSMTHLLSVMNGKLLDDFRYRTPDKAFVKQLMDDMMKKVPSFYPKQPYLRELLASLVAKGLVSESTKSSMGGNVYRSTWTVYDLTSQGKSVLRNDSPIYLPVPQCAREAERKQEERKKVVIARLESKGIKSDKLPADELKKGDGVVLRAYNNWFDYVERSPTKKTQLEKLLSAIEEWRSTVAFQHRMSPGSVLAEHVMFALAYAQATLPPGQKMDAASLHAAGVRSKELNSLVRSLAAWVDAQPAAATSGSQDAAMIFPSGYVQAKKKWQHAVYKPNKKTGVAAWEPSYNRFVKGESPQTIAMSQGNRKPIQATTVVGHLLEAALHGKKVDVARFLNLLPPPTKGEWSKLDEAAAVTKMDVAGDPESSGLNSGKFLMTDFLVPIIGTALANKPYADRTDKEKQVIGLWYDKLKWYMMLHRIGHTPTFEN